MTAFRDLDMGESFDFIGPNPALNSFFDRCRKVGLRTYKPVQGSLIGKTLTVGRVSCKVYHVA